MQESDVGTWRRAHFGAVHDTFTSFVEAETQANPAAQQAVPQVGRQLGQHEHCWQLWRHGRHLRICINTVQ